MTIQVPVPVQVQVTIQVLVQALVQALVPVLVQALVLDASTKTTTVYYEFTWRVRLPMCGRRAALGTEQPGGESPRAARPRKA